MAIMMGLEMRPSEIEVKRREWRLRHIDNILALLYPELEKPLKECKVLDVGCGVGVLSLPIAERVKFLCGIDINPTAIKKARERAAADEIKNVEFRVESILDSTMYEEFDIVLLSDVIEHVAEQEQALRKAIRALEHGGVFYLTTNNKLWPIEGHKYLPFLSYLPRHWANRYVRLVKGEGDYEGYYLLTYTQLKKLLNSLPITYTFKPPPAPDRLLYKIGTRLVRLHPHFWMFANAFLVIGKKI